MRASPSEAGRRRRRRRWKRGPWRVRRPAGFGHAELGCCWVSPCCSIKINLAELGCCSCGAGMLLGLALLLASVPLVQRAVANLFESQQRRRRLGVCRRSRRVGRREGLLQTLPVPPAAACEPPRRWLAPSFGPRCALRRVQRVEGGGHAGWTGASEGKRHGRACKCAGQRQQRMVTEAAGSVSPPGAGRCLAWAGSAMSGRGTSGEQLLQLSIPFLSCWSLVTSTSRPERFPFHKKSAPAGLVPPSAPTRVTRPASHTSHAAGVRTLTLGGAPDT